MKLAIIIGAAIVVIVVFFAFAAKVGDAIESASVKRTLRRDIREKGKQRVLEKLDEEIARLEQHIDETKEQSAKAHTLGPAGGPLGGAFQELQFLKLKRGIAEDIELR